MYWCCAKGSTSELTGPFAQENFQTLKTLPGIAKDRHGDPLVSGEITVVIVVPRKDGSGEANVTVRGHDAGWAGTAINGQTGTGALVYAWSAGSRCQQ